MIPLHRLDFKNFSRFYVLLWVDTQHFNIFFVCQLIEQCLWSAIPQNATCLELQCFPRMWLFSRVTPQGPCSFSLLRRIHALGFAWALCCVLLYKLWKRTELHIYMQNNWWLETNQNMHFTHDIFFEIYMQGRVSLFLIVTLWILTLKNCRHRFRDKVLHPFWLICQVGCFVFMSEIIDSFRENIHSGSLGRAMRVVKN